MEKESSLPNFGCEPTEAETTEDWWERGTQTREDRKRKREEEREQANRKNTQDNIECAGEETNQSPREAGTGHVKDKGAYDPFGEDEGDIEDAPEDHEEALRLLANQQGMREEYQDELEREWAARQEDQVQDNDKHEASPLLWRLPEEWWGRKPKLRCSPEGHAWCQPPGLYQYNGSEGQGHHTQHWTEVYEGPCGRWKECEPVDPGLY